MTHASYLGHLGACRVSGATDPIFFKIGFFCLTVLKMFILRSRNLSGEEVKMIGK